MATNIDNYKMTRNDSVYARNSIEHGVPGRYLNGEAIENKRMFDALTREYVIPKFNGFLDALASGFGGPHFIKSGAEIIGFSSKVEELKDVNNVRDAVETVVSSFVSKMNSTVENIIDNESGVFTEKVNKAVSTDSPVIRRIDNALTIDSMRSLLRDSIYPVGSVYISFNDINPSKIWGGTWQKLEDDATLLTGVGSLSAVGSNDKIVPLPKHAHNFSGEFTTNERGSHTHVYTDEVGAGLTHFPETGRTYGPGGYQFRTRTADTIGAGAHTHTLSINKDTSNSGVDNATINVIGRHYKVYMFTRVE